MRLCHFETHFQIVFKCPPLPLVDCPFLKRDFCSLSVCCLNVLQQQGIHVFLMSLKWNKPFIKNTNPGRRETSKASSGRTSRPVPCHTCLVPSKPCLMLKSISQAQTWTSKIKLRKKYGDQMRSFPSLLLFIWLDSPALHALPSSPPFSSIGERHTDYFKALSSSIKERLIYAESGMFDKREKRKGKPS